jgi:CheY-like chemotaxis protein/CHASE3 domain sensor protein
MQNKFNLKAKISLGNCISLILVAVLGIVAYRGMGSLLSTADWVKHTHLVLEKTTLIEKLLVDMETGERGFLIVGRESFLEPYTKGKKILQEVIEETKELVSDNPKQYKRMEKIQSLSSKWVDEAAKPAMKVRRQMNNDLTSMDDVVHLVEQGIGKQMMDDMRIKLEIFKEEERSLLELREIEAKETANQVKQIIFYGTIGVIVIALWISFFIAGAIASPITSLVQGIQRVREGDLATRSPITTKDEIGRLATIINSMLDDLKNYIRRSEEISKGNIDGGVIELKGDFKESLNGMIRLAKEKLETELSEKEVKEANKIQAWMKSEIARILALAQDAENSKILAQSVISELSILVEAGHGVFYVFHDESDGEGELTLLGSYGFKEGENLSRKIKIGEGLVGQCALEKKAILLTQVPPDYIRISSGLGEHTPINILVKPVLYQDELIGVIELASFNKFEPVQRELLTEITPRLGITLNILQEKQWKELLLLESQSQSEELQTQQEKLQNTNEQLEEQTQRLQASEEELRNQSDELQASYEQLNEKTNFLAQQKIEIEQKAQDLASSGKYKTEFLANMSHELRSPLNSLLILSQSLASNKEGNLTDKQVKSAEIIFKGGNDLLNLINDILDLSKVEAGKLEFDLQEISIDNIIDNMRDQFVPIAEEKGVRFNILSMEKVPNSIVTDGNRLEQILKNLLSNAFKFTEKGSVDFKIYQPDSVSNLRGFKFSRDNSIAFSVSDTGIGIEKLKQAEIFEAFQQGEGSITRKFGGTGLGLSISRELTSLLGGEIQLESEEGKGSVFTLFIPIERRQASKNKDVGQLQIQKPDQSIDGNGLTLSESLPDVFLPDDRQSIKDDDKTILIIEDDIVFAEILLDFSHNRKLKCLSAGDGRNGLQLAHQYKPDAILLDINLPDMDGISVLEQLKDSLETRHIPVHIVSAKDNDTEALRKGAIGYLAKPAKMEDLEKTYSKIEQLIKVETKEVLVIDDDEVDRIHMIRLLKNETTKISTASNGKEAIEKICGENYDCIILDLMLGDMSGFDLLEIVENDAAINVPPVIIHTGKELTKDEEKKLAKYTKNFVVKGANSEERLLDDVALFLHSMESSLSDKQQKIARMLHDPQQIFKDRKVLLVDDDARNVYALSDILNEVGMDILIAENGQIAIDKLNEKGEIDLVLMDIMMPVMDGLEAMQKIRTMEEFKNLPIIALTAKAMAEDKAKCIKAGANDYLTKPIEADKLLSLMRIWLFEKK